MKSKLHWVLASGFLVLIMGLPVITQSVEPGTSLEDMIKNAKTKADHEALAHHYELEAKSLTDQAEKHRHMGKVYGAMSYGHKSTTTFAQHCNAIAAPLEEAASESMALAKLHHELAAEAK
jgi:hypothetical protein